MGQGIKGFALNLLSLVNLLKIQGERLQNKDMIPDFGEMSGLEI